MFRKILIFFVVCISLVPCAQAQSLRLGTTFSRKQCAYLGLDWQETYRAILDFPFDIIRLGAYWDEIEKTEGDFDFKDLDWQIKEAAERGLSVVLTVGIKAPRWPEYHIPGWVLHQSKIVCGATVSKDKDIQKKALIFLEEVVKHYHDESGIQYWQVENEALNRFGGQFWQMDKNFLKKEIDLVKKLDRQNRPVVLTASTYPNPILKRLSKIFTAGSPLRDNLEMSDILGINVYPLIGQQFFAQPWYYESTQERRQAYFREMIETARGKGKDVWITELQAEPWEPGHLAYKENVVPPTGWPETTQLTLEELSSLGYTTFLFWGAEYWYFQKTRHQNPRWWEMINKLLRKYQPADLSQTPAPAVTNILKWHPKSSWPRLHPL